MLLYELQLHGTGWRVEQRPDWSADGWGLSRDVSSGDGSGAASGGGRSEGAIATSTSGDDDGPPPEARERGAAMGGTGAGGTAQARREGAVPGRQRAPTLTGDVARQLSLRGAAAASRAQERLLAEQPERTHCAPRPRRPRSGVTTTCVCSRPGTPSQPVALWRSPRTWRLTAVCSRGTWTTRCWRRALRAGRCTSSPRARSSTPSLRRVSGSPTPAPAARNTTTRRPPPVAIGWRELVARPSELLLCRRRVLRRLLVPSAAASAVHGSRAFVSAGLDVSAQHGLVTCLAPDQASGCS